MTASSDVLILTDLDDSLFSTRRKIPDAELHDVTLAARAAAGKDSYMTRKQVALVKWLDLSQCVPVTARGTEAYSRVTLPFKGPASILANGAVMLDDNGSINEDWARLVRDVLDSVQDQILALPDIMKQLASRRSMDIRSWAVMEPSCGAVYAVAKSNDSAVGEGLDSLLKDIRQHFGTTNRQWSDDWRFHINGNNLSVTPAGISKAIAVAYLLEEIQADGTLVTVGIGDSTSDLEFMRLCDLWLTPTHSQIDQLLGSEPA